MLKLPHNALISHASKVMLKNLQARLQQYVNHELSDVQAGFRKGKRIPEKKSTAILITPKFCLCRSQETVDNSSRDGNT